MKNAFRNLRIDHYFTLEEDMPHIILLNRTAQYRTMTEKWAMRKDSKLMNMLVKEI